MRKRESQLKDRVVKDAVSVSITPISWILAGIYALLAIVHVSFLAAPFQLIMTAIAATSAVILAIIAAGWSRWREHVSPHLVLAVVSGLVGANTCTHFILYPEPANTANFIIWLVGCGFLILSPVWFYVFTTSAILFWSIVVVTLPITPLNNWGWFLLFAYSLTLVIHTQRQFSMRNIAKREATLTRRDSALQSLINTTEMFQSDLHELFKRVCKIATQELQVDRAGLWLASHDSQSLRRVVLLDQQQFDQTEIIIHRKEMPDFFDRVINSPSVSVESVIEEPSLGNALLNAGVNLESRGLLISTIRVGGQVMGILANVAPKPYGWSIEDRTFGASLANIVAIAIQQQQSLHLEKRAQQAERLESLGILAGGVAHDFNNLLAVILGHAELLDLDTAANTPGKASIKAIVDAGMRARDLSRQMLAYSGRAAFITKTTDLAPFVRDMTGQLASELLGNTLLTADLARQHELMVDIDLTQIRQVLLNILLNAHHAGAKQITVTIGSTLLSKTPAQAAIDLDLLPHNYHWLEVADDGYGMDPVTLEHIFDPFFSTRSDGSGLGLAAVLGILRAHKGTITVDSESGVGTSMRVYFPASQQQTSRTAESLGDDPNHTKVSDQDVVLVEDDPLVRNMTQAMLEAEGNRVVSLEGLASINDYLATHSHTHFDIAIVDLTLGHDTGIEALRKIRSEQPHLPAVIMSGYDAMDALVGYADKNTVAFLQKPFNQKQLWDAVTEAKHLVVNMQ